MLIYKHRIQKWWKRQDPFRIWLTLVQILLIALALGFIVGFSFPVEQTCDNNECYCGEGHLEVTCNTCVNIDPVIVTGVANLVKTCDERETLRCSTDIRRYDITNCSYSIKYFSMYR